MAERTNEEKLDLFADLLEPCSSILGDESLAKSVRSGAPLIRSVEIVIRNHKAEVIQILALLDGVPVEQYRVNLLALPVKVMRLLNMPEVQELFTGAETKTDAASFTSAMETTKDGAN